VKRGDIILTISERRKRSKKIRSHSSSKLVGGTAKLVVVVIRRKNKDARIYGQLVGSTASI